MPTISVAQRESIRTQLRFFKPEVVGSIPAVNVGFF